MKASTRRRIVSMAQPVFFVLVFTGVVCFVRAWLDTPMVMVSNATGECVRVLTPEGPGSCDDIPANAERVPVQ